MIAYYIHHHGRGHLTRAVAIASALGRDITGLSSLPRPLDWPGGWIDLPLDDAASVCDPEALGRLHWVPIGSEGLRDRSALISQWIAAHNPSVFVVDVSVEVTVLARLHGVPVIVFALPGIRTDSAHQLAFDVAAKILAAWPACASGMVAGIPSTSRSKVIPLGAIGRPPVISTNNRSAVNRRRVVVLGGAGGDAFTPDRVLSAQGQTPDWTWTHLGRSGTWVADVSAELSRADVVIAHAGEGAIADVSAARVPAVILPQDRPYREQHATGEELRKERWPALVLDEWPEDAWRTVLETVHSMDGAAWHDWNTGEGAERAAREILGVAQSRVL